MSTTTADSILAASGSTLPRWTNTALVIAIGVSLALVSIQFLPQASFGSAAINNSAVNGTRQVTDPIAQGKAIIDAHLFGHVEETTVCCDPPPPPPPPPVELTLNGVFAYTPLELAIAIISGKSGEQSAYWIGDKVYGETTLKEVHPQYVLLDNRGRDEMLTLSEEAVVATGIINPARPTNTAQPIIIPSHPADIRQMIIDGPALLSKLIAVKPYQENGKVIGYTLSPKQSPEVLEAFGIYAGDVIIRANSISLSSQKQGIRALREAINAEQMDLVILRDGIEVPVSISFTR